VPSFRRRESVIDAESVDPPHEPDRAADALALAEEAEAEAAEAEAIAAAARARARAIRLRRQAQSNGKDESEDATTVDAKAAETESEPEPSSAVELTESTVAVSDTTDVPVRKRGSLLLRTLKIFTTVVAVACTAALVTLSVLMVINHRHKAAEQQNRAEFAAAARQSVVTLMSLDFNNAKEDVQRIIDNTTGQFHDDFQNQAEDFIKVTQDSKVITEVTVNATGIESMTDHSAVALVSASSRVTNAAGAKQEPRTWRLSVDLERVGDQIKMSKVEFVP
jgi:Mce-associated membrane protein